MSFVDEVPAPPRHRTAKDYVYDALSTALCEGRFKPGTRLGEKEISQWLNVSRTPVREAFAALAGDGLLQLVPHRGAVVPVITADDIREEYTVRAALELMAVELAVPQVPDEVLLELDELLSEMRGEGHRDFPRYLQLNKQLHLRLYSFSGRRRLVSMIESAWDKENVYRRVYDTLTAGPQREDHMHTALVDACRRRDALGAGELVKRSLLEAGEVLAAKFELLSTEETEDNITQELLGKEGNR